MANSSAEKKFDRARGLRARAKTVKSPAAKVSLQDASDRLEAQGARQISRIGRKVKPRSQKLT